MSRTALKTETLAVARAKRAEADEKVPPTVMGMDPGAHTGVALYRGGTLVALETITPREIAAKLADVMPARLVFEDMLRHHLGDRSLVITRSGVQPGASKARDAGT